MINNINKLIFSMLLTAATVTLHLGAVINESYSYRTQPVEGLLWVLCLVLTYSTVRQYAYIRKTIK